jgi:HAD superfamily hydrolase (TIGR01509 family)
MTKPGAVIFDLDGCLVDSEVLSLEALASEMRTLGISDATWVKLRKDFLGVSLRDIRRHVAEQLGRPCPATFEENFYRRLYASYDAHLPIMEGMVATLDRLQTEGIPICIATGSSIARMRHTLDRSGLTGRFGGLAFSADEVARGKPAPDLVLHAASNLGVAPDRCLVVEDSPHGVTGAVAAGMHAIGFVGGSHLDGIRDIHAEGLRAAGAKTVVFDTRHLSEAISA